MSKPDKETMQLLQQAKQLDQQGKEGECMAMATVPNYLNNRVGALRGTAGEQGRA